jgi:anthraniloyl-CoA monooxygenase
MRSVATLSKRQSYGGILQVISIGGGPAGLYVAILLKRLDPNHQITVYERNQLGDTFGFGVVFSDATLENFARADEPTYQAIRASLIHWDDIDTHYQGEVITSTGHGFSGLERKRLLEILTQRALELGVEMQHTHEITSLDAFSKADLILGADGVNSWVRASYQEHFGTHIDLRPNRFVWLGTSFPFRAFTFYFKESEHGMFRIHAYPYAPDKSTFIVECAEATYQKISAAIQGEEATAKYFEGLFSKELEGHPLFTNRSLWRQFPTIKNRRWSHKNIVLLGDAAHTAHFSIGSGTKLAMEDSIALIEAVSQEPDMTKALQRYEASRHSPADAIQRAAQVSLQWFEETERWFGKQPPLQFTFNLMTRSMRITHENLQLRDPSFIEQIDRWFMGVSKTQTKAEVGTAVQKPIPPMFTPYRMRSILLPNRVVVSPMCQYSAEDGSITDWHLVHLGSRAVGGAGLVLTEMTDVSPEGRITPGCAGLYHAEHVPLWRRVTDFVHQHSDAKIGVQLAHAGRKASTKAPWDSQREDDPLIKGAWMTLAPSSLPYQSYSPAPKEMTLEDMEKVVEDFVQSTRYAIEAGFDVIQLHMAHGYLLNSFLSPVTNQRVDAFGGSAENRLRFPLKIFDAVRATWPDELPLVVRISATDWVPGGLSKTDLLYIAQTLKEHGCDMIDVSTGQNTAEQKPEYGRLFQTPFSDQVRNEVGIPTMTVGAITSYADVNSILVSGRADLCVLARAHLFDPYWTRHAAQQQGYALPWPKQYRSVSRFSLR